MNRHLAAAPKVASSVVESLADRLRTGDRVPLDVAISLAIELLESVAQTHQERRVFGGFNAAEVLVLADGSVVITAATRPGEDLSLDTFSVGVVLYQLFTGLSPNQARSRLSVSPLHAVPPASLINPALDESIDDLLARLLDKDASKRPHSVRIIEVALEEVCESFDLTPSQAVVAEWWSVVPAEEVVEAAPIVVPAPVPVPVVVQAPVVAAAAPSSKPKPRHVPTIRFASATEEDSYDSDEEFDEDEAPARSASPAGPLRFDAWAVAACAFMVAAFTFVLR